MCVDACLILERRPLNAVTHVGLLVHSNVLLMLSFSYRLWVLRVSNLHAADDSQMRTRLWTIALVSTAPACCLMVSDAN